MSNPADLTIEQAKANLVTAIEARFRALVHNKTLEHYAAKLAERDLERALRDAQPQFDAYAAAIRATSQREAFEALTAEDWTEIEDGLCMGVDDSMNQAHMWAGRTQRETMYKAQADRTRATLAKVRQLRAAANVAHPVGAALPSTGDHE